MRNLLITNAGILFPQAFAYTIAYAFLVPGDEEFARIAMAIVALSIAIAALLFEMVGEKLDEKIDNFTVMFLGAAAAILQCPLGSFLKGPSVGVMVVLAVFVCIMLAVWKERRDGESLRLCFVVAIPGMGVPFGGAILLYRGWQNFRETAGWI